MSWFSEKKFFFEILAKGGTSRTFFLNKFFFDKNRNFTQKSNIKTESDRELFFKYFNEKRLHLVVKNRLKN